MDADKPLQNSKEEAVKPDIKPVEAAASVAPVAPVAPNSTNETKPIEVPKATNNNANEAPKANNNNANEVPKVTNNSSNETPKTNNSSNETPKVTTANTEGKKEDEKPHFYYTQRGFWGSPNANFTVFAALAIIPFTGLLGLDHFYLRSPLSGLLKAVGNLLTFGLWYFYDIAQVTGEADRVKKNGMSYPIVGPTGLGAGIFLEKDEEAKGATPLTFLIYAILVLLPLPFALDHFFVGDTWGGFAKIFANFNIFLFIFGIFWAGMAVFRLFFKTDAIFTQGVERVFPFTFFMDEYYCTGTRLGPKAECAKPDESQGLWGFIRQLFGGMKGIPVIGQLVGLVDTTVNYVNNIIPPIVQAGTAAAALAPKVISEVAEKTNELANSDRYLKQAGGGSSAASAAANRTHNSILLFVAFASVAAFGVFLAKIRNLESIDVTNFVPRSFQSILRSRFGTSGSRFNDVPPQGPSSV